MNPDPDTQLSAPPRAAPNPAPAPRGRPRTNWAGNIVFSAPDFHRPATVGELQAVVARARQVRVLATGHSFNDMADSPGAQVSLADLPPEAEIDSAASRVRVAAGLSYAALAGRLDRQGFALGNMASLPHISVAGACATGTHGSGARNQSLAAAVTAVELVTADGDLAELRREDGSVPASFPGAFPGSFPGAFPGSFPGAVVHLGALGVVTRLVLEVVPSFDVSQRVYEDLPLEVLDDHFADIMAAGYSVSMFTDWRAPRLTQLWIKRRVDLPAPPPSPSTSSAPPPSTSSAPPPSPSLAPSTSFAPSTPSASPVTEQLWFTARPAPSARNPVPGLPPDNCTQQLGVPGRWFDRLPHFRPEFTPSAGDELQSEYLLPAGQAVPALRALRQIGHRVAPVLRICEIRMIAADDLWLSPCYRRDSVAFHFTWVPDIAAVLPVVSLIEQGLAPFAARPHWGKVFTTSPAELRARYERLPDFLDLMHHYDPTAKFRNPYTTRYLTS